VDESGKIAKVKAPREELPLIIGREGQNVRLASKLTEYTIEVEGDDSMSPMETSGQAVPAEVSKEEKPTVEASEPEEKKVEEQEVPKTEEPAETLAPKEEGTEETVAETVVPQVTTEEPVAASPADSETEKIVEPVTPEETKPE